MPEVKDVHINQPLTNVAIGYPETGFIGPRLLQDVPVAKKSDSYYIFDNAREVLTETDDARAPGAKANEVDFDMTNATYTCGGHALQAIVPDEEAANADSPIQPVIDKTEFLVGLMLMNQEIALASQLATDVTNTSDPTNEWDDYTNGDPIADMKTAIDSVEDNTGLKPNVMAMDSKVWRALKFHPDILGKVLYGGTNADPANISPAAVATLFDLDEIIIGAAIKNTAIKGQSASLSRIWGSDVYVAYRPPRAGIKIPALGYRFTWRAFMGGDRGFMVETWRDDERGGDMVRVQKHYDQKITLAAAAYRLQNRLT